MPPKTWTLTDVDADIYQEHISLGPDQVGGPARGYRVTKRTLRGGRQDGVEVVEVDNGRLRFVAVPTRGMAIWRASCGDVRLGWKSPVRGPVHPAFIPTWEPSSQGWLSGFDELLARCGLDSFGSPEFLPSGVLRYPLHDDIAHFPAHKVEVSIDGDSGEIVLVGVVDDARLFSDKRRLTTTIRTRAGSSAMTVSDEIANISAEPGEVMLMYHINFGQPLVNPGARLVLPVEKVMPYKTSSLSNLPEWNVYGPESPGLGSAGFLIDVLNDDAGRTPALVRSAAGDRGVSVTFNRKQLPCFLLWKSRLAAADGYVTGLEPATHYPNGKTFEKEKGRVVALAPGETRRFDITIEAHTDAASVAAAEKAVASVQGGVVPELCPQRDLDRIIPTTP